MSTFSTTIAKGKKDMSSWPTFVTPSMTCTVCSKVTDRASAMTDGPAAAPEEGDVTVCLACTAAPERTEMLID